ncbi:SHIRT domain-containing protein [Gordonibacter sp. An230]|uniref:SHIRT domain-containing protein n=1 Tax=Gordonibacter sp. An230 TaxID=1965592 RepID=UPI0013A60FE4|nr:SHIRT domain-containing protein [Gordonibacter sp. An230]
MLLASFFVLSVRPPEAWASEWTKQGSGASVDDPFIISESLTPDAFHFSNDTELEYIDKIWGAANLDDKQYVAIEIPEKTTEITSNTLFGTSYYGAQIADKVVAVDFSKATNLEVIEGGLTKAPHLGEGSLPDGRKGIIDLSATKVWKIRGNTFKENPELVGVVLPDTLTEIGTNGMNMPTFGDCPKLEWVLSASEYNARMQSGETLSGIVLPEGIKNVYEAAFDLDPCPLLDDIANGSIFVVVPESVEIIGERGFQFPGSQDAPTKATIVLKSAEHLEGFDNKAFSSSTHSFNFPTVILPDFQDYGDHQAKVEELESYAHLSWPVDLQFMKADGTTVMTTERKLRGFSLQYELVDGEWVWNDGYRLPSAPSDAPEPQDGFVGAWTITGTTTLEDGALLNSEILGSAPQGTYQVTWSVDDFIEEPTIWLSINGKKMQDITASTATTPTLQARRLDTVGVTVDHPLLKTESTGSEDTYVEFKYLWYDRMKSADSIVSGARTQASDGEHEDFFYTPAEFDTPITADRLSAVNEIPLRTLEDARNDGSIFPNDTGDDHYFWGNPAYGVQIFGTVYKNGVAQDTFYFKSAVPLMPLGTGNYSCNDDVTTWNSYDFAVNVEPAQYTITFDSAGGSEVDPVIANEGETITEPAIPVRDGYEFAGWYDEDGSLYDFSQPLPMRQSADDGAMTLTASWTPVATSFEVSYSFRSATPGLELPAEVLALLPPATSAAAGSTVTPEQPGQTSVRVAGGTWTFAGWDRDQAVADAPVEFVGTWQFAADASFEVSYSFRSATPGLELPAEVLALLPPATSAAAGSTVTPEQPGQTSVRVAGGTWTFAGWDRDQAVADAPVEFVGTWQFAADASSSSPDTNPSNPKPGSDDANADQGGTLAATGDSTGIPAALPIALSALATMTAASALKRRI